MKKIYLFVICCLYCISSVSYARNGIYLTLDGGFAYQSGLPSKADSGANSITATKAPSAIYGSVGYNHDLLQNLGIGFEMGLGQYGKTTYHFDDGNTVIKSGTSEYLASILYHLQCYDIMGKVGGIRITSTVSGEPDHTRIRPELVLGGDYNINPHLAVTLSYTYIPGSEMNDLSLVGKDNPTIQALLAGLRFTF